MSNLEFIALVGGAVITVFFVWLGTARDEDAAAGVNLSRESDATPFCFCPACHTYTGPARMIYPGQTLLERTCPRCTRKANREDTRRIALKPWQTITKTT